MIRIQKRSKSTPFRNMLDPFWHSALRLLTICTEMVLGLVMFGFRVDCGSASGTSPEPVKLTYEQAIDTKTLIRLCWCAVQVHAGQNLSSRLGPTAKRVGGTPTLREV